MPYVLKQEEKIHLNYTEKIHPCAPLLIEQIFYVKKCGSTTERCIDLSEVNMKEYEIGEIILGDIDMLGWIVVKGNPLRKTVRRDMHHISVSNNNKWFKIDHSWRSQKYNSGYDKDEFLLLANSLTTDFLDSIKTSILDKHLPNKNYIVGKTNLLINLQPIVDDQWPHSDFRHKHE